MTDTRLRLAVFDVDGTLIDSQLFILAAMRAAFAEAGIAAPDAPTILSIVGLSLPQAVARLAPDLAGAEAAAMAETYRRSFIRLRAEEGGEAASPMYPGARAALDRLRRADILLGVATGKARRGLDHTLRGHGLDDHFTVLQSADDAPSKPDPGMLLNCLAATGVAAADAVMIGDTEFDVSMARNAGLRAIGVAWGYHPVEALRAAGADVVIDSFAALDAALEQLWAGR